MLAIKIQSCLTSGAYKPQTCHVLRSALTLVTYTPEQYLKPQDSTATQLQTVKPQKKQPKILRSALGFFHKKKIDKETTAKNQQGAMQPLKEAKTSENVRKNKENKEAPKSAPQANGVKKRGIRAAKSKLSGKWMYY